MPQAVVDTIKMVALGQQAVVFNSCSLSWDINSVIQPVKGHSNQCEAVVPKWSPVQLGFHCIHHYASPNNVGFSLE